MTASADRNAGVVDSAMDLNVADPLPAGDHVVDHARIERAVREILTAKVYDVAVSHYRVDA